MQSGKINYHLSQIQNKPANLVLSQVLLAELENLTTTLRKQVRNVVAVSRWMQDQNRLVPADQDLARRLPELLGNQPEVLSFLLPATPEAFHLLSQTLLRQRAGHEADILIDREQQVLQIKVNYLQLAAWEYEWSVFFENINPAAYLETLLLRPWNFNNAARKAS